MIVNTSTPHKYNSKQHLSSLHYIHRLDKRHHQLTHIWHINSLENKQMSKWPFFSPRSQQIVNSNALECYITNTTVEVKSKVYDRKKELGWVGSFTAQSAGFSPCLSFYPFSPPPHLNNRPLIGPPIPCLPLHLSLPSLHPTSCPLDTPAPQCSHALCPTPRPPL